jgi:hypothetical protein
MRLHLMVHGKKTTISVSEALIAYMLARLGGIGAEIGGRAGRDTVRKWIQKTVKREQLVIPEKNVSQWVQARILGEIVDPVLKSSVFAWKLPLR